MRPWVSATLAALSPAALLAAPAVDPRLPEYRPAGLVSGSIAVAGAPNLNGIVARWIRDFARRQPGVRVRLDSNPRLSSDGVQALLDGRADLAPLARELFPSELARLTARFGSPPLTVCVALGSYATLHNTDAIAFFVNAANPLPALDLAQLDAIFSAERRRGAPAAITAWSQLGLAGAWADRPIHAYGMVRLRASGDPPGIVNFLEQRLLLGARFSRGIHEVRDGGGVSALTGIADRVGADPDGIGYGVFGHLPPGVRVLALAESPGALAVAGTPATVAADTYPLTRRVYLCLGRTPGQPLPPAVREFLRFALGREGQQAVAADPSGYLPVPPTVAANEREKLK